jgi:hypothetical protein
VIASLLYTAVAHACSELHGTQVFLQAAWDHGASRGESPDNAENDNCESIRFALLSTPASFFQAGLLAVHSIAVAHAPLASVAPPDLLSMSWRSQNPRFPRLGASPHFSHIVLRI